MTWRCSYNVTVMNRYNLVNSEGCNLQVKVLSLTNDWVNHPYNKQQYIFRSMNDTTPQITGKSDVCHGVIPAISSRPIQDTVILFALHDWVVTERSQYVSINYPHGTSKGWLQTLNARNFQLHSYLWYKPLSNFILRCMSAYLLCVYKITVGPWNKFQCWRWDSYVKKENSVATEQIFVKIKVNSGRSLELASHCQQRQSRLGRKYSWTTMRYPSGVTITWDLKAIFNCSCAAWQQRKKSWKLHITHTLSMIGRLSSKWTLNV